MREMVCTLSLPRKRPFDKLRVVVSKARFAGHAEPRESKKTKNKDSRLKRSGMTKILDTGIGLILLFAIVVPSRVFAGDSVASPLSLFYKGNIAYKDGDYKSAVESYEQVVSSGKVSGNLYFNLGNSYFKSGHLGKAVLNYERARRLIPRDGDLESNFDYAISQIPNYDISGTQGRMPQRWIMRWEDALTVDEAAMLVLFLYIVGGGLFILGILLRWPKGKYRLALAVTALILLGVVSLLIHKINVQSTQAVVLSESDAKFEPRSEATTYFKLSEGIAVNVVSNEGDWVKIIRSDGKTGWVKKEGVEKI